MPAAVSLRAALAPLIALVLACPGIAAGQDLGVCAPLEGTGSYSQCINEQLTRQRKDLREDAPGRSPRPVQRPDFVITDPDLRVPDYRDTMTERTERDMEAARRNSDLRTRQLQQQIRRDLQTGPLAPPPLGMPQLRPPTPGFGAPQPAAPWMRP